MILKTDYYSISGIFFELDTFGFWSHEHTEEEEKEMKSLKERGGEVFLLYMTYK